METSVADDREPLDYESREERVRGVRIILPADHDEWTSRQWFWFLAVLLMLAVLIGFLIAIGGTGFPMRDSPYDPPDKL